VLQRLVEARSGRGSPAVDGKDGSRPVHLATGYHQEVGVLQLDDKDGSRPRHLTAMGTIRRSVCCSAWSRLARGADHLQSTARTAHGPSISLPWVPSGGRHAAAR
jgi:hypothetical protein